MRNFCIVVLLFLVQIATAFAGSLSNEDRKAITALVEKYRTGWLSKNSQEQVMSVFATDAVLMPHHGDAPVVGEKAIREFWWPSGVKYTIDHFTVTVDGIEGNSDYAYARGKSNVTWTTFQEDERQTKQQSGTYLTIVKKTGKDWKIVLQMWDDPQPAVTASAQAESGLDQCSGSQAGHTPR